MAKPRRPAKKTPAKPRRRPVRARKPAAKAPRRAPAAKPRKAPARARGPQRHGDVTRSNDFAATGELRDRVYYHGTTKTSAAEAIRRHGIEPPEVKNPRGGLAPVVGRVYLTPHISYALIYALGGDVAGTAAGGGITDRFSDPYGYVFAVHGRDLGAIQPDEDSVGEMVFDAARGKIDVPWLWRLAVNKLTDNQLRKVKDGEYVAWAQAGKKLVKLMSPAQQEELVRLGAHVAQVGSVMPFAAWRVDRRRMVELKRDGSNFFDIAEPWDEPRTRPNHHGGYHAPGDPLGYPKARVVVTRTSSGAERSMTFHRAFRDPSGMIAFDTKGGPGHPLTRRLTFVDPRSIVRMDGRVEEYGAA